MADFAGFSASMRTRATAVSVNADRLVRKVALVCDQAIVSATPVDTGRARSNWIASLDEAVTRTQDAYTPGEAGSTAGANVEAALQQARQAIGGYNGDVNRSIHITNNLPYIERLNEGWSRQAPAQFVEEALADVARAFDGTVLTTKDGVRE